MSVSRHRRQWLTLAVVALGVFVTALDNSIVNVALPSIQDDLHLGLPGVAWVVNSYILAFAVFLLTAGRLADAFGRRRLFLIGLAVFSAASLIAGLAPSAGALIAARALQGVGAALLTPPTLAIVNHTFQDSPSRGTAIGIWGAVAALAFAIGPLVGGLITEHLQWMWVFFVNVPLGALGLVAGARVIPESTDPDASTRVDLPGVLTSTVALSALTYGLIKANDLGWGSPAIVALFAVALLSGAAFVAIERRAAAPTVDLALFRIPAFSGANVAIMIFNLGTFGVFLYTSLYFQHVLGYSPVKAGAALLPWILVLIVVGPFTGKLTDRLTPRLIIAGGLTVMASRPGPAHRHRRAQPLRRPPAGAHHRRARRRAHDPPERRRSRRRSRREVRRRLRRLQHRTGDRRFTRHRRHRRRARHRAATQRDGRRGTRLRKRLRTRPRGRRRPRADRRGDRAPHPEAPHAQAHRPPSAARPRSQRDRVAVSHVRPASAGRTTRPRPARFTAGRRRG